MKIKKKFIIAVYRKLNKKEEKILNKDLNEWLKVMPQKSCLFVMDLGSFYFGDKYKPSKSILNKKFNYIKINNISELNKFTKNHKCYCLGFTNRTLKEFYILYLLKKFKILLVGFSNVGFFANVENYSKVNLLLKIRFIFAYRFSYYFYRILLSLRLTPPIEYFLDSSNSRIKSLNKINREKSFFYKKIFPPYYKKLIRINSVYSNIKKNKFIKKNNLITYIDSGLGHDDVKKLNFNRDLKLSEYYKKLTFFLNKVKIKKKKPVYFCLHPKAKYPKTIIKLLKKNFFVKVGTKDYYLYNSEYLILNITTLVNKIIFIKKKIIIINSTDLGNWISKKILNLINEIHLSNINLESKIFNLDKIFKESNKSLKFYDFYIKNNLIEDKSKNYYESIKDKLNKI
jgi:hypothetical protein